MDIAVSSRPSFSAPSPTPSEKISLQASNTVYTYHCLCSHLLLATTSPLGSLPTRKHSPDGAHIMPLPPPPSPSTTRKSSRSGSTSSNNSASESAADHYGLLISTRLDRNPQIITSESGFEKRYLQRCGRCDLIVGYQLDWQQFSVDRTGRRDDYVFLLPGGLIKTSDMVASKSRGEVAVVDDEVPMVAQVKV